MTQPLATVKLFFSNADAYSDFLARVEAAIVAKALELRAEEAPGTITGEWTARQTWAVAVLSGPAQTAQEARDLLPSLAVKANDAGLIQEDGTIEATDAQIIATIDDAFIDLHAGYIPA